MDSTSVVVDSSLLDGSPHPSGLETGGAVAYPRRGRATLTASLVRCPWSPAARTRPSPSSDNPPCKDPTMALTDDESAVLRSIAAQLSRDDPRLVSSLRTFGADRDLRSSFPLLIAGLLATVAALLVLAVWPSSPAASAVAVLLALLVPVRAWVLERRSRR